MVVRLVRLERFLHFLYILELAVAAWNILELIAHQPYILQTGCLQLVYYLLVLLVAHFAELAHLSENCHLMRHIHHAEVLDGGCHARWVGIVGIYHQLIVRRLFQLRTVVAWDVVLQGVIYLLRLHIEMKTDGDGGKHVVDIVRADEMGLNLMPVEALGAPAELQERSAGNDFSPYIAVFILAVGDEAVDVALLSHLYQMLVVCIDEDEGIVGCEVIIELSLGLLHAFEDLPNPCRWARPTLVIIPQVGSTYSTSFRMSPGWEAPISTTAISFSERETEERLWYAYIIIEVALSEHHVELLAENSRDEFLGGGLAVGSGDSYYRNIEVAAMLTG